MAVSVWGQPTARLAVILAPGNSVPSSWTSLMATAGLDPTDATYILTEDYLGPNAMSKQALWEPVVRSGADVVVVAGRRTFRQLNTGWHADRIAGIPFFTHAYRRCVITTHSSAALERAPHLGDEIVQHLRVASAALTDPNSVLELTPEWCAACGAKEGTREPWVNQQQRTTNLMVCQKCLQRDLRMTSSATN